LVVALILWANLVLAGDVAAWLGWPRWRGIAVAGGAARLLLAWRGAGGPVPPPLFVPGLGPPAPPAGPWCPAGHRPPPPGFRPAASSPWVDPGHELRAGRGPTSLLFEEEHRVTAAGHAQLHIRAIDGARVTENDWDLRPGETVTLRSGDELRWPAGARL